jgi:hypothetical protein
METRPVTYTVPPAPKHAKPRFVRVTDAAEIAAIEASDFRAPIGKCENGVWYAEAMSLAQFRRQPVEFVV